MTAIPANIPFKIFSEVEKETGKKDEKKYVLLGPLTTKQLAEMGMVKDSSITKAVCIIPSSIPFLILSPLVQEPGVKKDEYSVLIGPLTKEQLTELGFVKDKAITNAVKC
ncbi:MAG: hypothetical protein JSV88_33580 [Candidatus Aminicenantes bacterium]|nr:MAG: hypothetical protein JSV88_33580 [Candidatus Aminicenantes bacterium]